MPFVDIFEERLALVGYKPVQHDLLLKFDNGTVFIGCRDKWFTFPDYEKVPLEILPMLCKIEKQIRSQIALNEGLDGLELFSIQELEKTAKMLELSNSADILLLLKILKGDVSNANVDGKS